MSGNQTGSGNNMREGHVRDLSIAAGDSNAGSNSARQRLLAVGGIHVFEGQTLCTLVDAQPANAVKNLVWAESLALEAECAGSAAVECDGERLNLEIVIPVRLEIELVSDSKSSEIAVGERFRVQAQLYDHSGRALEVGKFTQFEWTASEALEVANDRSSGEFGLCDTCYGLQHFRALQASQGVIAVRLGALQGAMTITAVERL